MEAAGQAVLQEESAVGAGGVMEITEWDELAEAGMQWGRHG